MESDVTNNFENVRYHFKEMFHFGIIRITSGAGMSSVPQLVMSDDNGDEIVLAKFHSTKKAKMFSDAMAHYLGSEEIKLS